MNGHGLWLRILLSNLFNRDYRHADFLRHRSAMDESRSAYKMEKAGALGYEKLRFVIHASSGANLSLPSRIRSCDIVGEDISLLRNDGIVGFRYSRLVGISRIGFRIKKTMIPLKGNLSKVFGFSRV